jgi:hypothetical protein
MFTAKEKFERLEMVVALLQDADAMLQGTLGASDECYELHNAIENIAEEIAELGEALLEAE